MRRTKTIQPSQAKTAWGLCAAVCRAFLLEPKRANMRWYYDDTPPICGGPACRTTGCLAGWICFLNGNKPVTANQTLAQNIIDPGLRLDYHTVGPTGLHHVFNDGAGDACESTRPGTRAHALAAAARMRKFMRVNEAALKAGRLR